MFIQGSQEGSQEGHILRAYWGPPGVDICKGNKHLGFAERLLCARHRAKGFLQKIPSLPLNRSRIPAEMPRRERLRVKVEIDGFSFHNLIRTISMTQDLLFFIKNPTKNKIKLKRNTKGEGAYRSRLGFQS